MTIPAEGISSENCDVISVEHDFVKNWITKASMANASDIRQLPSSTPYESLQKHITNKEKFQKGYEQ